MDCPGAIVSNYNTISRFLLLLCAYLRIGFFFFFFNWLHKRMMFNFTYHAITRFNRVRYKRLICEMASSLFRRKLVFIFTWFVCLHSFTFQCANCRSVQRFVYNLSTLGHSSLSSVASHFSCVTFGILLLSTCTSISDPTETAFSVATCCCISFASVYTIYRSYSLFQPSANLILMRSAAKLIFFSPRMNSLK